MDQRISDESAYVLHRRDWQNTSLIIDFLTENWGRVSLVAKGAKSGKNKGLLQSFNPLSISWSGRSDLKTLTGADGQISEIFESNYISLLYVNELLTVFLPPYEPAGTIFGYYQELISSATKATLEELDLRLFEYNLMQELGYLPDLSSDSDSGEKIRSDLHYYFDPSVGFTKDVESELTMPGSALVEWLSGQGASAEVIKVARRAMRQIIDFNLAGKRLKSREVYKQIKSML